MKRILVLMIFFALGACTQSYSMVAPGVNSAANGMSVSPASYWNKSSSEPVKKKSAIWTTDGFTLDSVTFYSGIADGESLLELHGKDDALPVFRADMLPNEVAEMIEATYVSRYGSEFELTSLKPRAFGGTQGFEIEYNYMNQGDLVQRRGKVAGAIKNGTLYLIMYEAPAMYYFNKNLADADRIMNSAVLP